MILHNRKMYVNVPKNNLNYWGYKLVTKKYVENSANLRYPAKNDRFLAGERR